MSLKRSHPIRPTTAENDWLKCTILKEIDARLSRQLTRHQKENTNGIPAIIYKDFIDRVRVDWRAKYENNRCEELVTLVKMHNLAKELLKNEQNRGISVKLSNHKHLVLYRAYNPSGAARYYLITITITITTIITIILIRKKIANNVIITPVTTPLPIDEDAETKLSIKEYMTDADLIINDEEKIALSQEDIAALKVIFDQLIIYFDLLYPKVGINYDITLLLGSLQKLLLKICSRVGASYEWSANYTYKHTTGNRVITPMLSKRQIQDINDKSRAKTPYELKDGSKGIQRSIRIRELSIINSFVNVAELHDIKLLSRQKDKGITVKPIAKMNTNMNTIDEDIQDVNRKIDNVVSDLMKLYEAKRNLEVAKHIKDGNETFLPTVILGHLYSPLGAVRTFKEEDVDIEQSLVDLFKSRYGFFGVQEEHKRYTKKQRKEILDNKHKIRQCKRNGINNDDNDDEDNNRNDNDNDEDNNRNDDEDNNDNYNDNNSDYDYGNGYGIGNGNCGDIDDSSDSYSSDDE